MITPASTLPPSLESQNVDASARDVVNPEASCMIVSSQLFESYLECSTKCWLRSRAEPATGNFYAEWARAQNETYFRICAQTFARDRSRERPRDRAAHS